MRQAKDAVLTSWLASLDAHFKQSRSLSLAERGTGIPQAWFLGPKAENEDLLSEFVRTAIKEHCNYRRSFHPGDPRYITGKVKQSKEYRTAVQLFEKHAANLFTQLKKSVPFFSMRYQGHMLWDQALPAIVGYFGAMLYNQNNVAAEASPVTTILEIEVGNDLCRMLGYPVPEQDAEPACPPIPWGHITCDGSVANIEALWAARNAKFFALGLRRALLDRKSPISGARDLEVKLLDGKRRKLIEVDDPWVLLNLKIDDVVDLPLRIKCEFNLDPAKTTEALGPYSLPNVGLLEFYRDLATAGIKSPVVMAPISRHYSWPKAGTLLGLGKNSIQNIAVDLDVRMDVGALRGQLARCLKRKIPVIAVVAVIGSTEESAVDPLRQILDLRNEFRGKGLDFAIHCDAAWGGYFNCIRRKGSKAPRRPARRRASQLEFFELLSQRLAEVPEFPMSDYVNTQYEALPEADSITVDPHKAGYVPYPAGALCYRNSAMRDLISLRAPVIFHSQSEPTVGVYGIEGSKPGAAAAAAWLAHKVIPPTQDGYGKILGQCMWTSNRLYCRLLTLKDRHKKDRYEIVVLQRLPAERKGQSAAKVKAQRKFIKDNFVHCTNKALLALLDRDPNAKQLFRDIGSDQVILGYTFNFYEKSGHLNTDAQKLKDLNDRIFEICSITVPPANLNSKNLILNSSTFDEQSYGKPFLDNYCRRLGVVNPGNVPIPFLISTTMDPWTTDTPGGDFLQVVEDALRDAVNQAIRILNV